MTLRYLLDTNICIYISKKRPLEVYQRLSELSVGDVGMSLVTFGELRFGAEKSQHREVALEKLEQLGRYIPVIMPTQETAEQYGLIRNFLEQNGQPIGNNDLWIAAHALSINTILVTNNTKEFIKVPDLLVENWVNPS
ncbi:MAG: type II toxin-antitoxin system VapC family toxin [Methylovulum sp.]|uniref:type II toxin-antitoxin system tRNA(fMet)-specific endonuclease VapC n=1 Tax=Methylovulum sp. TaxID=1916980 RepID=UPI002626F54A|nr:type II toxin-antitoxin system VapC family toxin [Methylovulum sp.]MDD2723779.1 type II toxin-antitoxin system VapC family toxin [Methylovulum sp.]MDD5123636.1 type II toxin-antitoxin system VapC family toxin [Methylovulum sp.]